VQVVGRVLGQAQHPPVGEQEVHLGWGLGAWCHLELQADAVDDLLLTGVGDVVGGGDEPGPAGRPARAEPDPEGAGGRLRDGDRGVVVAAAQHGRSGIDVLGHGVVEEVFGCVDRDGGVGVDHTEHAAEVVDVGVGVDDRGHRAVATVGAVQGQRRRGDLLADQRVDHDHARSPSTRVMFDMSKPRTW
jgi:hypothetical protein